MKTLTPWLLRVTRVGLFFVPFVALIVSSSLFFPFITGKGFAFRIIIEVVFACWLLLAIREPAYRPKSSALLWCVTVFLGIVLVADLFAVNPFKAFWSNFERMEGFITLLHLYAYFLVASSVLNEEKWWHRLFATFVGVSAFLGIYGALQLAGKIVINQGGVRLDGTFGNAAYFAGFMLFLFFLTLFLFFRHRIPLALKWLYGGAFLLQLFVLYFSATRGSAVGLAGGLCVSALLLVIFERHHKKLRIGAVAILAGVVLVSAGLYLAKESPLVRNNPVLERFSSISVEAAGPRFMVWTMAWQGFKEHPILGWGQEGFNYVFNKYYDPQMWGQEQWFDRTHNIFFDWLIAAGFPGLLSYLSLFAVLLWYLWRGKPTDGHAPFSFAEKSALTGLLAAYVIHNFFVFDNLVSYILFFSFLAFVQTRFSTPSKTLEALPVAKSEQSTSIVSAVLLVALALALYFLNIRPIGVSKDLIYALRPQDKGVAQNLAFYKEAFAPETIGTQEVAEQAMQAAVTVANASNVPVEMKNDFVSFALTAMKREIDRSPSDARLRMFIGGFLNRLGRFEEALPQLEKAHTLSPQKQTVAFELSNTYLSINKNAEALALLKEAYDRAPEYIPARVAYAVAAIYAKQFDIADILLAATTDLGAPESEQLVKAYYAMQQYPKVIALLKSRLIQNPSDAQSYVSLAAAYLSAGNRTEAVAALQKAIELNPDFKQQGEFYIKEIRAGRNP